MHSSNLRELSQLPSESTVSTSMTNRRKGRQSKYLNRRMTYDTKGPISQSSEGNSYIMFLVDAFTHLLALKSVLH